MSEISEAIKDFAKSNPDYLPSVEGYRTAGFGGDTPRNLTDDLARYQDACKGILQQKYIFENMNGKPPQALYVTGELMCILRRGYDFVSHRDGADTFAGIPIRPCGGSGCAFHFAENVFEFTWREDVLL